MKIEIPLDAKYLFLSITDVYYRDNLDTVTVYIEHTSGNESNVEPSRERRGIPGFPYESILIGIAIDILINARIWRAHTDFFKKITCVEYGCGFLYERFQVRPILQ